MEKLKGKFGHRVIVEAVRDGDVLWREDITNIVFNEGLNDILDSYYKGTNYTAAHYLGLTSGSPTFAVGDTMASHAGWSEVTAYSESARPTIAWGTASSGSISNSGSPAQFTINASTTVGGVFITTNATKGGTAGKLIAGAAFSLNRILAANDTLLVTVTAQLTSS
jgi:hypothetical protein